MPRFQYMLNSFRSGELGPRTHARTDVTQYANGLDTLKNFIPYATGGAGRRPGLSVLDEYDNSSVTQGANVNIIFELDRKSIYQIKLSYSATGTNWFIRSVTALGTPTYDIGASSLVNARAQAALGEISETEIEGFNYVQIDNTIVVTHNSSKMEPLIIRAKLDISDDINFVVDSWFETSLAANEPLVPFDDWTTLPLRVRLPFQDPNISDVTLTPSGTAGVITVTSSTGYWESDHIGSVYMLDNSNEILVVGISAITSATVADAQVLAKTTSFTAAATDYWYESSWSQRRGFPKCVEVHDGRLIFGGTTRNPATVWASFPFLYGQFNRHIGFAVDQKSDTDIGYNRDPANVDGGVQYTIASQGAPDQIAWIKGQRTLLIGTNNREYIATLNPANVGFTPQSNHGGSAFPATNGNNSTFFISADGQRIHEIRYSEENGAFVSRDLTNLNDELLHKGNSNRGAKYKQICWNESLKTLFCLTTTGKVNAITIEPNAEVTAMSSVEIQDTEVKQITNLFSSDANSFIFPLFTTVNSNGSSTQEWDLIMTDFFEGDEPLNESPTVLSDVCNYLDYAKSVTTPFAATNIISVGTEYNDYTLDFLCENEDGDIVVYQGITVAAGSATLPDNIVKYVAGVSYQSLLKTLTVEVGANALLNSQGDIVRIDRVTAKLFKSWVGVYGENSYTIEDLNQGVSFTGETRLDCDLGPDNENKVIIETDQPLPLNILGLVLRGQNHSG